MNNKSPIAFALGFVTGYRGMPWLYHTVYLITIGLLIYFKV